MPVACAGLFRRRGVVGFAYTGVADGGASGEAFACRWDMNWEIAKVKKATASAPSSGSRFACSLVSAPCLAASMIADNSRDCSGGFDVEARMPQGVPKPQQKRNPYKRRTSGFCRRVKCYVGCILLAALIGGLGGVILAAIILSWGKREDLAKLSIFGLTGIAITTDLVGMLIWYALRDMPNW